MLKFCTSHRGSIALILCMVLLPIILLSGLTIDGTRIMLAQGTLAGASELTMQAALANYNEVLKDVYGIFALSKTEAELKANLNVYFTNTIQGQANLIGADAGATFNAINGLLTELGGSHGNGLMRMDDAKITVAGLKGSQLIVTGENGTAAALERQIIEYMKYRGPINLTTGVLDRLGLFGQVSDQNKAVEKEVAFKKELEGLDKLCQELYQKLYKGEGGYLYLMEHSTLTDKAEHSLSGTDFSDPENLNRLIYEGMNSAIVRSHEARYYLVLWGADIMKPENITLYDENDEARSRIHLLAGDEVTFNKSAYEISASTDPSQYDLNGLKTAVKDVLEHHVEELDGLNSIYYDGILWRDFSQILKGDQLAGNEDTPWREGMEIANPNDPVYANTIEMAQKLYYNVYKWDQVKLTALKAHVRAKNVMVTTEAMGKIIELYTSFENDSGSVNNAIAALDGEIASLDTQISGKEQQIAALQEAAAAGGSNAEEDAEEEPVDYEAQITAAQAELQALQDQKTEKTQEREKQKKLSDLYTHAMNAIASGGYVHDAHPNNVQVAREHAQGYLNDEAQRLSNAKSSWDAVDKHLTALLREATETLYQIYGTAEMLDKKLNEAIKSAEKLKKQIEKAQAKRGEWKNSIDELDSGSIKTSLEGKYDQTAEEIDPARVDALITMLNAFRTDLQGVMDTAKSVKIYDIHVYGNEKPNGYSSRINNFVTLVGIDNVNQDLRSQAERITVTYDQPKHDYELNIWLNDTEQGGEQEGQEFWRYLRRTCAARVSDTGQQAQENARETKKNLLDTANKETVKSTGASDGSVSGSINTSNVSWLAGGAMEDYHPGDVGNDDQADDGMLSNNRNSNSVLDKLTNLASTAGETLLLEEYMSEMFSCYTTNLNKPSATQSVFTISRNPLSEEEQDKLDTTLSGYMIRAVSNAQMYRAEQEYILWGQENASQNIANTLGTIYALRLVVNTIYAMTNAELNQYTLSLATAIAGWTGFGVPIVQVVLDIALAMGETAVDLSILKAGGSVVFFKSTKTWILSPENLVSQGVIGVVSAAATKAGEIVSNGIDSVYEQINSWSADRVDEMTASLNQLASNTKEAVNSAAESVIITPLQELSLQVITDMSDDINISGLVDDALGSIQENINSQSDSAQKTFTQALYNAFKSSARGELITLLETQRGKLMDAANAIDEENGETLSKYVETAESVRSEVLQGMKNLLAKVSGSIDSAAGGVNAQIESMRTDVMGILQSGADDCKEKATARIREFANSIAGAPQAQGSGGSADATVGNSGLQLSYQDYLKILLTVGLAFNKQDMLKRTAALIQVNLNASSGEKPFQRTAMFGSSIRYAASGDTVDMTTAYTMVSGEASAHVQTLFMNVTFTQTARADGSTAYGYQRGSSDTNVNLSYRGVLGY